jgi:hypothetical protein
MIIESIFVELFKIRIERSQIGEERVTYTRFMSGDCHRASRDLKDWSWLT